MLATIFAAKLVVMVQLKDHVLTQPDAGLDTTAYAALAEQVLKGNVALGPGLYFLSPLYIYFLAAILGVTNSFAAVRVVQIVLGTCGAALVYVAGKEWFGRRAALFAAALAGLTGSFSFYESLLLQTSLDPFLTAAALACLTLALTRDGLRWYVLSGLAFGAQVLNRPNIVIPAAVLVVLVAVFERPRSAAALAAGLAIAMAPLSFRNMIVAGDWSPLPSQGGLNFYIGNNPGADGTYRMVDGITPNIEGQQADARVVAEQSAGHALSDAGVSRYFYSLGWTWIRRQPLAAARLFAHKLALIVSAADPWLNFSFRFFASDARTLLRALPVGAWLLIPLGALGLAVTAPRPMRAEYLIWASFMPMYAVAVAAFFVADRYRLPLLVPLCIGGGAALDALLRAISAHRWKLLLLAGTAWVALFAWVNRPVAADTGVGEERTRMAERLITLGSYEEGEQWAVRAEAAYARPGLMHFRVGQRFLMREQLPAAIQHFQKALQFDPGQGEVELLLGGTLVDAQRPNDAIPHLRRALAARVRVGVAGYNLARALAAAGDRTEAIATLENLTQADRTNAERQVALGELAMQLRAPVLAEQFFRVATAARQSFAPAHTDLAAALLTLGRLPEARVEAQEALKRDPNDDRAKHLLELIK